MALGHEQAQSVQHFTRIAAQVSHIRDSATVGGRGQDRMPISATPMRQGSQQAGISQGKAAHLEQRLATSVVTNSEWRNALGACPDVIGRKQPPET